ncbi:MAG: L,D-transpeptidase family protein [Lachnospiraceae bacterium]|nr:L,D-transpeptidase family protein [Lachnospiraceae bacterium]
MENETPAERAKVILPDKGEATIDEKSPDAKQKHSEKVFELIPETEGDKRETGVSGDETGENEGLRALILKNAKNSHPINPVSVSEPALTRIEAHGRKREEDKRETDDASEKEAPVQEEKPDAENKEGNSDGETVKSEEKTGVTEDASQEEPEAAEKPKPVKVKKPFNKKLFNKIMKRILLTAAVILVFAYFAGLIIFLGHFYPGTKINGIECGMKTPSEAEELISLAISGYEIEVDGRNGLKGIISSGDINLKPVFNGEVKSTLKSQKPYIWFLCLRKPYDYSVEEVTLYSKEALRKCVSEMPFFAAGNIKAPKDAYIGDITDEGYVITKEDNGSVPIEGNIIAAVASAVDTLKKTVSIDNDECYKTADVTSEDKGLITLRDNLNEYCAAKIIYRFGDEEEILDGKQISEWINVDGTDVEFDEEKVSEYVKSLARRHDTFGQPHAFKTHSGEEITITQGAYGWWINRAEETQELIAAIKSGYRGERTPVYKEEAAQYGEPDYGDDYVEIDLTSQHLWVYKDGAVVADSDFVSGNISKNNGTHVGIYGITYKERDATLSGANYASHVSYWMPFNGNEGMHDATWRSSFGGDIYLTSGSHGCVNLPLESARKIFDLVEKGEAVIVYGGKKYTAPVQETPEPAPEIALDPMQQLQLLIDAGILNPDGTIPETTTVQE